VTDDLQALLRDRASSASFDPVDLSSIELDGTLALRRRKRVRLLAGLAALLFLGTATTVGLSHGRNHAPQPIDSPPPAALSWADGSVIHDGSAQIDVGRAVVRYVRTTAGFVFTDPHGLVWSWKNGTATMVGHTPGSLFTVAGRPLAGWVDEAEPDAPASFVVLNQATGQARSSPARTSSIEEMAPGQFDRARLVGLDDNRAWWLDGNHYYRATLDWSAPRRHADEPIPSQQMKLPPSEQLLAASTAVLVEENSESGEITTVREGRSVDLGMAQGDVALLGPDNRYVAFGNEEGHATAQVYDTESGKQVRLEPAAWSALITQWLTDKTVAVLVAARESDHYRLETCSVQTAHCTVAVPDLGSGPTTGPGNGLSLSIPTGDYWFPYPHG
jgi:hypothetical protein